MFYKEKPHFEGGPRFSGVRIGFSLKLGMSAGWGGWNSWLAGSISSSHTLYT
uniref:Uncharacterized protein n=1 Tax=Picea glauca TaxID=3330 RepID=A0A117NG88_PICGL|nr:hypothetical protein ABT39_MTgene1849 [Picea glauca]